MTEEKMVPIQCKFTRRMLAQMDLIATNNDMKRTELVREAVRRLIKQEDKHAASASSTRKRGN